jgi:hypothetical protein
MFDWIFSAVKAGLCPKWTDGRGAIIHAFGSGATGRGTPGGVATKAVRGGSDMYRV